MKMRLIDVNDLLRDTCNECRAYYSEAKQSCPCNHGECDAIFTAKEIQNQLTIEAEPIKHGKWKGYIRSVFHGTDEDGDPIYRDVTVWQCQRCSRKTVIKENYCPNCGAKMEE